MISRDCVLSFLTPKPAYDEAVEPDLFVPSHPRPLPKTPNPLLLALRARQDFLTIWARSDYRPRVSSIHVLKRQVTLVNAPEHVKYVLATRHANFERKTPQMRRSLEKLLGDGLFISDGDTWAQRRPLVADIVHKAHLPVYGKVMETATAEMLDRWAALPRGTVVDAQAQMAELTANIICRAVFGNDLAPEQAADVVGGFGTYQRDIDSINVPYFMGADEGWPVRETRSLRKVIGRVRGVIDKVVGDHVAGRGDHDSMIQALVKMQAKLKTLGLTVDAIRNEAATIFMAGYETTAGTLAWALYCLDKSPWARAAMRAEIRAVCGDRAPTVEDVPRLDYCRAVIDETLRLYPPVPILGRQAREDDQVGERRVEAGSLVLVVPWLLHRTEAFFPEPHRFRPERFLEGRPQPYTYLPFAAGPRICAGLAFGQTEATLCLATIVRRFDATTLGARRVDPVCRLTLRPKGGLPMTLSAR